MRVLLAVLLVVGLVGCGSGTDPNVATLEDLGAVIKRNDQGEVVTVSFDTPLIAFENKEATTDTVLVNLKGLAKLQNLCLSGTKITDAGLVHLKGLTALKDLDLLLVTNVTDAGLVHLKGLTNLRTLSLSGTKVTSAGVADLKKALPNCTIIK